MQTNKYIHSQKGNGANLELLTFYIVHILISYRRRFWLCEHLAILPHTTPISHKDNFSPVRKQIKLFFVWRIVFLNFKPEVLGGVGDTWRASVCVILNNHWKSILIFGPVINGTFGSKTKKRVRGSPGNISIFRTTLRSSL